MYKIHYHLSWLYCLLIIAFAGCDSTNNIDQNNLQLTMTSAPTTVIAGEFSTITATLNNVNISVATGTSVTTTTPVPGYAVTFTITNNASNCAITVVNSITDASGHAIAIYRSGAVSGTDVIQASIDSGQTASTSIIVKLS
jgi:hypothetical protein